MAELEAERVKLAKRERKEANGLLDAVGAQDVPRVTHLLAIGVNPDARIDNAHPCSVKVWPNGASALAIAIGRGNVPIARLLLEAGASTELAVVERKMTPLMAAAVMNKLEGAQLLVEWSAKLNAVNNVGKTALSLAAQEGFAAVVQFLVDSGADLNAQDGEGMTALHWAAHKGHLEPTRILLDAGAELDLRTR
jgi:ankyrin repeat protein